METVHHYNTDFNFDKRITISAHSTMDLISLGTRTKYYLVIYGVGLYTYPKINKISDVYSSNYTKCLQLKFYRSLDYEQMYNALVEVIEKKVDLSKFNSELKQMYNILKNIRIIEYTDKVEIVWCSDKLELYCNNVFAGFIVNKDFVKVIFDCYLDENSITPDLLQNYTPNSP